MKPRPSAAGPCLIMHTLPALMAALGAGGDGMSVTSFGARRPSRVARASNWTDAARLLAQHPRATLFVTGHSMRWTDADVVVALAPIASAAGVLHADDRQITVDARLTTAALLDVALARGRYIGGFPDASDLSVGGVVRIGGVGPSSASRGLFADNARAFYGFRRGSTKIEALDQAELGESVLTRVVFDWYRVGGMKFTRRFHDGSFGARRVADLAPDVLFFEQDSDAFGRGTIKTAVADASASVPATLRRIRLLHNEALEYTNEHVAAGRVPRWICRWFTSSAAADGFIRAARSCVANDTAFHVRRDRSRRLMVCIYSWGRTHAEAEPRGPLLEAVRHCYPRLLVESAEYPI